MKIRFSSQPRIKSRIYIRMSYPTIVPIVLVIKNQEGKNYFRLKSIILMSHQSNESRTEDDLNPQESTKKNLS